MNFFVTLAAAAAPQAQNPIMAFLPMIAIFAIFYFLLIAPMRKRQKKTQEMLTKLKKGDEVITNGGVYGRVSAIDEKTSTVILQVADQIKIRVSRAAIAGLQSDPADVSLEPK